MSGWTDAALVALGAALGAPARHLTGVWLRQRWGATPVAGTLVVNVAGSFVLGLLAGPALGGAWLALIGIGFCGAYTTFSTLALDLWSALAVQQRRYAVANATLSLTLGLAAAYLGFALTG